MVQGLIVSRVGGFGFWACVESWEELWETRLAP